MPLPTHSHAGAAEGGLCSLNGRILPVAEARISPLDRGLIFGDAVYETLRVEEGELLFVEAHGARLRSSLAAVEIVEPSLDLEASMQELVRVSGLRSASLFVQVTRGVAPRAHRPPRDLEPTVLQLPSSTELPAWAGKPLRVVTLEDPRWSRCDVKTTSLMGTVLGKLRARGADCDEVLFLAPRARGPASAGEESTPIREGGSTSFFVVTATGILETHPLDGRVLPGITRARALQAAAVLGLALEERAPRLEEAASWREAFLCGTLTGLQPVVEIDGQPVGRHEGRPAQAGETTRALAAVLAAENRAEIARRKQVSMTAHVSP